MTERQDTERLTARQRANIAWAHRAIHKDDAKYAVRKWTALALAANSLDDSRLEQEWAKWSDIERRSA